MLRNGSKCSCRDSGHCLTFSCECFIAGDDCGESCLCQDDCRNSNALLMTGTNGEDDFASSSLCVPSDHIEEIFETVRISLSDLETIQELDNTPTRQDEQLQPPKKCIHCSTEYTPQWRSGPSGPSTLCNACGIHFLRYETLPNTYRPMASPTFNADQHTNRSRGAMRRRNRQGSAQIHAPQGPSPALNNLQEEEEEDNDGPPKK